MAPAPEDPVDRIIYYHDRTKHHPMRFARSLGYLDWDTQPDPFRRFDNARAIALPIRKADGPAPYESLYSKINMAPEPLSRESIGRLFELALGITAWKGYNTSTWALRANPSSGNLHPTEGYCILPPLDGISDDPGVYHYRPRDHSLEERCRMPQSLYSRWTGSDRRDFFFIALTSIHWREAWKYGERAFRYCQHDAGHALGSLRFAAAALGWRLRVLPAFSDHDLDGILGLDRADGAPGACREEADCIACVDTGESSEPSVLRDRAVDDQIIQQIKQCKFFGVPNVLGADRIEWEVIDFAAEASRRPRQAASAESYPSAPPLPSPRAAFGSVAASAIVRQRRSATRYDGASSISSEAFFDILNHTIPRSGRPPFDTVESLLQGQPRAHLALFVHRVDGLERGLYFLLRDPRAFERLRATLRPAFLWQRVPTPGHDIPLYLLKTGDMSSFGRSISCDQEIAGDGAFSLGMICDFEPRLRSGGAHEYKLNHWEAGLIGQVIYLECEVAGIRATGIGCFYDDEMHGLLGIRDHSFQSLYHFAAGAPVNDIRIQTRDAYEGGDRP